MVSRERGASRSEGSKHLWVNGSCTVQHLLKQHVESDKDCASLTGFSAATPTASPRLATLVATS